VATLEKNQISEVLGQRAELIEQMRELNASVELENRDMTSEEEEKFKKMDADAEALELRAARMEKLAGLESARVSKREVIDRSNDEWQEMTDEEREAERRNSRKVVDLVELREKIEKGEVKAPSTFKEFNEMRQVGRPQDDPSYRWAFFRSMTVRDDRELAPEELRVLSKASAGAGLNLVPTTFERDLIELLRFTGVMRDISRVISTESGAALQVPVVSAHGVATWTAENAAFTVSDETFGQSTLNAYKAATIMLVSEELLADSAFDLAGYIGTEFSQRIGVLENTAYMVGDGSGKPTGVTTQASAGVTSGAATTISYADVLGLFHSLPVQYRRNAVYVLGDAAVKAIRLITGSVGQPLWQPALTAGAPDTLLGKPVYIDPDMASASAVTTGIISGLFGDFSYYWIRDVNGIAFQRLNELYAANGQVGFRAYHRTDGKLMNTAAIKKLTQA
jgi:HK97 family phage major capsid protein